MDIIFYAVLFVLGFLALGFGADLLLRGAARLAVSWGVAPLVIGLTVVTVCTDAPELFLSGVAAWGGATDIALGNVIGSNICNILLGLGLAGFLRPVATPRQLIVFDVPIMIGLTVAFWGLSLLGTIDRGAGLVLLGGAVLYFVMVLARGRRRGQQAVLEGLRDITTVDVAEEHRHRLASAGLTAAGMALLGGGAQLMVYAVQLTAMATGFSTLFFGLSLVALGTTLPELATVIVGSIRGHHQLVLGNLIGSNIFNILAVMGLSALLAPAGIAVSGQLQQFAIPVMVLAAAISYPVIVSRKMLERWEGALLVCLYLVYVYLLWRHETGHPLWHYGQYYLAALGAVVLFLVGDAFMHRRADER